jgi:hypothetical protein
MYEIIDHAFHENPGGEPFMVALVDDPTMGDTKIVIMFPDEGYTAVLSLDQIADDEDVSEETNTWRAGPFERLLRHLWD